MSHPVAPVTPAQAEAPPTVVRPKSPEAKFQSVPTDTVQISTAAVAALKEASKAESHNTKEGRSGDFQASKLLR